MGRFLSSPGVRSFQAPNFVLRYFQRKMFRFSLFDCDFLTDYKFFIPQCMNVSISNPNGLINGIFDVSSIKQLFLRNIIYRLSYCLCFHFGVQPYKVVCQTYYWIHNNRSNINVCIDDANFIFPYRMILPLQREKK